MAPNIKLTKDQSIARANGQLTIKGPWKLFPQGQEQPLIMTQSFFKCLNQYICIISPLFCLFWPDEQTASMMMITKVWSNIARVMIMNGWSTIYSRYNQYKATSTEGITWGSYLLSFYFMRNPDLKHWTKQTNSTNDSPTMSQNDL